MFAEGGSCDRLGIALWPCRWAALTKCDQDDVLDGLANSMFLLRLMACVAMGVSVLRRRCNTLEVCKC